MTWANTVTTKANGLITRYHGRAKAIRGFTCYHRWLSESPELCLALDVVQTGSTYDTSVRLRTSKKALGHNLVRFQEYNSFLRRKAGGSVNVDALAAFVAILIMTKIPSVKTETVVDVPKQTETVESVGVQDVVAPKPSHATTKPCELGEGTGLESWEDGDW